MTTNPLRADELRERIAAVYFSAVPKINAAGGRETVGPATRWEYDKAYTYADQVLALLTPPPSLASVVAEIDDLIERNNLAMHRDGSVSGLFMGSLAWKLFNNWPQLRTALTISGTGWRPEVRAFADLMEAKLRENDHKPGWKGEDPRPLLRRLNQEFNELETVISKALFYSHWKLKDDPAASWPQPLYEYRRANDDERAELEPQIGGEAADVANFAMMIADVCGALPQPKTGDA